MWLESHGNLARHPKTRRLMQRMGWTLPTTIGNLHLLWYWALEYAPTGDITKFQPDELTHDLDLGEGTPEQFLESMIESGFLDRSDDGAIRIHDWPDYTAKSLRPRFRRDPDRWHQVLRSYGLPVITLTPRRRDVGATLRPPSAESTNSVGNALRAVRRDSSCATVEHGPQRTGRIDCDERRSSPSRRGGDGSVASGDERNQSETDPASALKSDSPIPNVSQEGSSPESAGQTTPARDLPTEQQMANMRRLKAELPRSLSLVPGFTEVWWPRLLDMYASKGTPLDPGQRRELLSRLCMRPNYSVRLLKHCVENKLECKWEHLADGSS